MHLKENNLSPVEGEFIIGLDFDEQELIIKATQYVLKNKLFKAKASVEDLDGIIDNMNSLVSEDLSAEEIHESVISRSGINYVWNVLGAFQHRKDYEFTLAVMKARRTKSPMPSPDKRADDLAHSLVGAIVHVDGQRAEVDKVVEDSYSTCPEIESEEKELNISELILAGVR